MPWWIYSDAPSLHACLTENVAQQFDSLAKNIYVLFKLFFPRRTLSSARTLPWRFGGRRTERWWSSTATRPRSSPCTSSAPGCWSRSQGYTCWWGRSNNAFPENSFLNLNVSLSLASFLATFQINIRCLLTKKRSLFGEKTSLRLVHKLCTFKFAKFVSRKINLFDPLQVNNASVMWTPLQRTPEGFERHFAVNHLAAFVCTR